MPHGYATPDEALVEALLTLGQVPPEHDLVDVRFGQFAASVGGGYYFDLRVSYSLSNTVQDSRIRAVDPPYVSRTRYRETIAAWCNEQQRDKAPGPDEVEEVPDVGAHTT